MIVVEQAKMSGSDAGFVTAPALPAGLFCLANLYDGEELLTGCTWWLQMKGGPRLLYDEA